MASGTDKRKGKYYGGGHKDQMTLKLSKRDIELLDKIRRHIGSKSLQKSLREAIKNWHTIITWEEYKNKRTIGQNYTWRQMCEEMSGEVNEERLICQGVPVNERQFLFKNIKHNHMPFYYKKWRDSGRNFFETFKDNE